ncbi:PREDICTED: retinol dehydrogenase 12-like [Branchiostoma belcheri]|uniref:Retinol dehydrogenase 12-like n=1 Tax=Branchiostoma belcheri TaxID=7741 RepID=A0A6P4Z9P6_BRABE|nr:PREDICTED: retinol dehydrogenase 12-like [Branchiostoma belcheri]
MKPSLETSEDMAQADFLSVLPYVAAVGVAVGLYFLRRHVKGEVCRSDVRLNGKTAIVTGANTGIGKATALELADRGARVILACRNMAKAKKAASDIRQATGNGNVVAWKLDLASLTSVRAFAGHINTEEERLDILVNNAGVMWCPQQQTEDGFELQFGVNHLGHFLLTNLLLDKLKASAPSRVVTVSAVGHKSAHIVFGNLNAEKSYSPYQANFQSKLANALFSRELAKRTSDFPVGTGVSAFSVDPGPVRTELARHMPGPGAAKSPFTTRIQAVTQRRSFVCVVLFLLHAGTGVSAFSVDPGPVRTELARHMPQTLGPVLYPLFWVVMKLIHPIVKTPREGAQTSLHCAVAEGLEACSGMYFKECAPAEPAPQAKDDAVARRLWEVSEEMVGINT